MTMFMLYLMALLAKTMAIIPSSVILSIPDGDLTDFFLPSPPGNPFQRNESYHCFEIGLTTGYPNYVSGVAQGFWYFEGPIAHGKLDHSDQRE